jgi:hypothetical protein
MSNEKNIDFTESFILGWKKELSSLKIFCEFFLLPEHPLYKVFDKGKEYGCYKLGALVIDLPMIGKIPLGDNFEPKWNNLTNEYEDVFDIDFFEISNGNELRIESENLDLLIIGKSISIELYEGEYLIGEVSNG